MGLTRIKTGASTFIQPDINGAVSVIIDPGIDWIKEGDTVHIKDGGLYLIQSVNGFIHHLVLQTAIKEPGQLVRANVIMPVSSQNQATVWGGISGKEW